MPENSQTHAASWPVEREVAERSAPASFWPTGWWRVMDINIGIISLPIYLILVVLLTVLTMEGEVKSDAPMMIAVLVLGGFTCAEIGKRLPLLHHIGAAAIFATFIPSALVYYHLLPAPIVKSIVDFTKFTNFLYVYIAAIIVGSILGMDRQVLIKGFLKIFVPLAAGSIAAGAVGTLVGTLLGLGPYKSFFFVVVPIMAGGVGEGAIPLSIGYSAILGQPQGDFFAQVLPPVMLGSLTAIIFSGMLNFVGKKYPHLTGEGRLQPSESGESDLAGVAAHEETARNGRYHGDRRCRIDRDRSVSAGRDAVPPDRLAGAGRDAVSCGRRQAVQRGFAAAAVGRAHRLQICPARHDLPVAVRIGVSLTPWDKLMAAFTIANLITIVATVSTLMLTGAFVGRFMSMYPIETAIVNACHSGQGGTGDVAILTAANRMQLMPFAQIATRIGGAITVTAVLVVLRWIA